MLNDEIAAKFHLITY